MSFFNEPLNMSCVNIDNANDADTEYVDTNKPGSSTTPHKRRGRKPVKRPKIEGSQNAPFFVDMREQVDNSLGETLANSLKLIATSGSLLEQPGYPDVHSPASPLDLSTSVQDDNLTNVDHANLMQPLPSVQFSHFNSDNMSQSFGVVKTSPSSPELNMSQSVSSVSTSLPSFNANVAVSVNSVRNSQQRFEFDANMSPPYLNADTDMLELGTGGNNSRPNSLSSGGVNKQTPDGDMLHVGTDNDMLQAVKGITTPDASFDVYPSKTTTVLKIPDLDKCVKMSKANSDGKTSKPNPYVKISKSNLENKMSKSNPSVKVSKLNTDDQSSQSSRDSNMSEADMKMEMKVSNTESKSKSMSETVADAETEAPQSPTSSLQSEKLVKKRGRKKKVERSDDSNDKSVISDSEMMKPIVHSEGAVTLYQCEVCHKLFNKKQTLRQHFITHTDRFACQFCDARCKSKGDLRTHIQTHTKEKPFHCDVCNTHYTRESILRKHLTTQLHLRAVFEKENEDMINQLELKCGKSLGLLKASKTRAKIEGYPCNKCTKVFLTRKEYKKHMKSHIMTYVCNICQKGCKSALLLKIHSRVHTTNSKLSCKNCSRKFATLQGLKDHMKTHKATSSILEADENLLKAVISRHNKDMKLLKPSIKVDGNVKPKRGTTGPKKATYECKVCKRMFTSEKRLSNHLVTHNGLVNCNICLRSFSTSVKLANHMREHDKKLKRCEICHAGFANEEDLTRHVENMHCEGNELACKICYKKFESAAEVHKHMNDHAPTMLFSGASLDEGSIPVVPKGKSNVDVAMFKVETDESSDEDGKPSQKAHDENVKSKEPGNSKYGNESPFSNAEFVEILEVVSHREYYGGVREEGSDFEDEMFSSIIEVLECDVMSSAESNDSDDDIFENPEKPIIYCHGDIMRKHSEAFEQYSFKDPCRGLFQCTLCMLRFDKENFLVDHLKTHVCEYCNKFYTDLSKLSSHRSVHMKRLLHKIDHQTKYMLTPKPKWRTNAYTSSDSESEVEDRFLSELEEMLDTDLAKKKRADNFLKTLSHDDIVKANKPLFDQHSFVDLENNIFACTICKRKYARPTTLTRHFKTHVCQYCNTFFIDKSDLLEHKYRHRKRAALMKAELTGEGGKMPPSPVVSKQNRANFKRYSYIDQERNINRCTLCSKDFVRRTVLTRHLKTHICSHCDKFFEDKYDLNKHITDHKVEKLYTEDDGDDEGEDFMEYEEPDKRFTQAASLTASMEKALSLGSFSTSFHTQPNEPITYIELPNRGNGEAETAQVFSTQTNGTPSFQIISQPVNNSETFLVSAPPNNSIIQSDSERERLFECGECGKRFYKNGHLKSHMTIHTGSRPFVCSVCNKAFSRGTTLRKHEKTHIKRCKICGTTFSSKYELDLHLEMHRTYSFYK